MVPMVRLCARVLGTGPCIGHKLGSLVERSFPFPRHGAYGQTLCTSTRYWPLYTKPPRRKATNYVVWLKGAFPFLAMVPMVRLCARVLGTGPCIGHKLSSLVERSFPFPRHGAYGQPLCTSTRYWPLYTKPPRRKATNYVVWLKGALPFLAMVPMVRLCARVLGTGPCIPNNQEERPQIV